MPNTYDAIVIGVGAMGSAACWQLAARGKRVLGLEQFAIPHERGSSHGASRMIRKAYYEHADYVPLLHRSYALWQVIEQQSGRSVLFKTGGIYIGPPDGELVAGSASAATMHDLPCQRLSRRMLADRFPAFRVPDDHEAVYEPEAGYLVPDAAITSMTDLALRAGAVIRAHEPVLDWESDGSIVRVRTQRRIEQAASLIIAGGAWAGRLVRDARINIAPTRQALVWVWPRRPDLFGLGRWPVWAVEVPATDGGGLYYGFPIAPEAPGMKFARHAPGAAIDPDQLRAPSKAPTADDAAAPMTWLEQNLPDAAGPLLAVRTCMYEMSDDGHFIIDRHPAHHNVLLACGFSGHGFKFAPVVGEALADLATDGAARLPIGFLGLARFGVQPASSKKQPGHA